MRSRAIISAISMLLTGIHAGGWNCMTVPAAQETCRETADTVSIMVIGDIMMHSRQMEYDYTTFLENIRRPMEEADFSVVNMEFPLAGKPYTGYPAFSAIDGYESYVARCGADVFLMANNHLLDRREAGLERTLERYRSMSDSIRFTGAASNAEEMESNYPLMLEKGGIRIALINFGYGSNAAPTAEWPALYYTDKEKISAAIHRAEAQDADFIVALPHWGIEYQLKHSPEQESIAEWLVENGVDAIVGAHPHVVQDSTHIDGVPVIYSVGNAISNMSAENTRLELAVTLRFVSGDMGKSMLEPELRFMWCTLPGKLTPSYSTIFIDEWTERRGEWIDPSDYDNMMATLKRVQAANSIGK